MCEKMMTDASVVTIPLENTRRDGKDEHQELEEGAWGDGRDGARMRTCS